MFKLNKIGSSLMDSTNNIITKSDYSAASLFSGNSLLWQWINKLQDAKSINDVKVNCQTVLEQIGVQFFKYSWYGQSALGNKEFSFYTCPPAWLEKYMQEGYSEIDPKVRHCKHKITPMLWSKDHPIETNDEKVKEFWTDSYDYGLTKGITIPIRGVRNGFGMLCTSFDPEIRHTNDILHTLPTLQIMAPYIHETIENLVNKTIPIPDLTNRELECLKWAVNGKTAWETAQILKITERTAIFHLQNSTKKLAANNKYHAISKAIAYGIITI